MKRAVRITWARFLVMRSLTMSKMVSRRFAVNERSAEAAFTASLSHTLPHSLPSIVAVSNRVRWNTLFLRVFQSSSQSLLVLTPKCSMSARKCPSTQDRQRSQSQKSSTYLKKLSRSPGFPEFSEESSCTCSVSSCVNCPLKSVHEAPCTSTRRMASRTASQFFTARSFRWMLCIMWNSQSSEKLR